MRSRLIGLCLLLGLQIAASQKTFSQTYGGTSPIPNASDQIKDPDQEKRDREIAKKANQERQAQLKSDTARLLKLATELNAYVDKSNENTLSLDVIKKADDIERLARSIRDKMKGN